MQDQRTRSYLRSCFDGVQWLTNEHLRCTADTTCEKLIEDPGVPERIIIILFH
jgi:hypothetical protein